jgi:DNA invertase Pin-like site-specific DNA recombinase
MQTFFYARVSSTDQTVSHQRDHAEAAGYVFDEVITDEGVSGVSTRMADRKGGAKLLDKLRRGDVLVVRWVDRLGRNYEDVTETIRALLQRGVVIKTIINGMTFDGATKDPVQKAVRDALIAFMAATAQAQTEATKEAQKAGIEAARAADQRRADGSVKYRGRKPTFGVEQLQRTNELLSLGWSPSAIAAEVCVPRATVYRIKEDPARMARLLHVWKIA